MNLITDITGNLKGIGEALRFQRKLIPIGGRSYLLPRWKYSTEWLIMYVVAGVAVCALMS